MFIITSTRTAGVQEIIHEANVAQNRTSRSDAHQSLRSAQQQQSEATHLPSGPTNAAAQPTSVQISPIAIPDDSPIANDTIEYDAIPTPVSSSYVVPGSGTLKETHIFTPSKVIAPFVFGEQTDLKKTETAVRIDENVVKKEYHDIEYNPNPSSPVVADEFSDFQFVSEKPQLLQPIQSGVTINWPDPGRLTGVEMESFDQLIQDDSSKSRNVEFKEKIDSFPMDVNGKESISIENNPIASPKSSINIDNFIPKMNRSGKDSNPCSTSTLVNDFLSVDTNHVQVPFISTSNISEDTLNTISTKCNGFDKHPETILKSNSLDDFSDFQSVPIVNNQSALVSSTNVTTNMSTPLEPTPMLIPTSIQPTAKPSASQIAWPDPGIDSDEMARLEAIFPTPKTISLPNPVTVKSGSPKRQGIGVDEVEWTDFVSSSGGFQPITHIINQNILKHQQEIPPVVATTADDDDWSDFVSSGTSTINQFIPPPMTIATSMGPNFPSWNASTTSSFGSWTPSTPKQSSKPDIAQISNRMPTVSLIPDLGFIAPTPPSFIRGSVTTSSARNGSSHQPPLGAPARK